MAVTPNDFFGADALLDRLTDGVSASSRPVVFLIGSAVTAPTTPGNPGVPGVEGVIDLIRAQFNESRRSELEASLAKSSNRYQTAFSFLHSRRGQDAVNDTVKKAVWHARRHDDITLPSPEYIPNASTSDDLCKSFDGDTSSWILTPAADALGELITYETDRFGRYVLTTNFDPLIGVAIARYGGKRFRSALHRDGSLGQTEAEGCHIVHLHGYWYGTDTLHTPRQLTQERPRLRASLSHILKNHTLVVIGYGGWNDVFTSSLLDIIEDDRESPDIIWTQFAAASEANPELLKRLEPGLNRGTITLYDRIDCHDFLPKLVSAWRKQRPVDLAPVAKDHSAPEEPTERLPIALDIIKHGGSEGKLRFDDREQDRPPHITYYVGREEEAKVLDDASQRIIFITGIGGQGKSALAANYVSRQREHKAFDYYVWRDCKEEGERFEAQLLTIVHSLIGRNVPIGELSRATLNELIELYITHTQHLRLLLVFDNVDHYLDLESYRFVGAAATFIERVLQEGGSSKVVFTCRPSIAAPDPGVLAMDVKGLDFESAKRLFHLRGVSAPDEHIERAHAVTQGHAFWLDLIAAQVGRNSDGVQLAEFLDRAAQGHGDLPVSLKSIWDSLKEREQIVLRTLAEAVRPITTEQLSDYAANHLRWNEVRKAASHLRSINLIVVKLQDNRDELLELHPLVRAFVRKTFARAEQTSIIDSMLRAYLAFFGIHRSELSKRPRAETIDKWIEAAELCAQSGKLELAFEYLDDVARHFQSSGHTLDFIRVADTLLRSSDWSITPLPRHFDSVSNALINAVSTMGRTHQARALLDDYKASIPHKDARYINFCNLMCHFYWISGDFFSAIKWGVEGVELKRASNVDTTYDSAHNLALAQRDSGAVEDALQFFLHNESLEKVLEPDTLDKARGGAFYGNIGRTLHLMRQIDNALVCYRKSALIIEEEPAAASIANKGYIRQWVGELMYSKSDMRLASACFSAAHAFWELVAPPKAELMVKRLRGEIEYRGLYALPHDEAEQLFQLWLKDVLR